jgi:hypothetical protein
MANNVQEFDPQGRREKGLHQRKQRWGGQSQDNEIKRTPQTRC